MSYNKLIKKLKNSNCEKLKSGNLNILNNSNIVSKISLELYKYPLELRTSFGTAHSQTTFRENALIVLYFIFPEIELYGIGEIGLPPRKKMIYIEDLDSIMDQFNQLLSINNIESTTSLLPEFPANFFSDFHNINIDYSTKKDTLITSCMLILSMIDNNKRLNNARALRSGIEMCVFDMLGKVLKKPLYKIINSIDNGYKRAFYTISAVGNAKNSCFDSLNFGKQFTNNIKIKVSSNIDFLSTLKNLVEISNPKETDLWILDANSSWDTEFSKKLLKDLKIFPNLFMIEQPYPVNENNINGIDENWISVLDLYNENGILLFADESVTTISSIEPLSTICNGVNIKLEKVGGIRNAVLATIKAKELGLKIWIGIMVTSIVGSTAAAHLCQATGEFGDMDGALLVNPNGVFDEKSGFQWGNIKGGSISWSNNSDELSFGLGIKHCKK